MAKATHSDLPGVALHELWRVRHPETALGISFFVIATSLLGMLTVMLAGVNERRKEFAMLAPSVRVRVTFLYSTSLRRSS